VVAVNGNGEMQTLPNLKYRLIQEDWDYQWYYSNSYWDYSVSIVTAASRGDSATAADKPVKVGGHVDWGSYRLEVFDRPRARPALRLCRMVRGAGRQLNA
jgi:uncharacterized protein YfaS (alpha-2-macroglobulin family)